MFSQDPPWDVSITSGTGNVGYQTGNHMCNTFCAANMPHVNNNNNNKNTFISAFLPFTLSTEAARSSKCYTELFKHLLKALLATVTWLPIIFSKKMQKLEIYVIFFFLRPCDSDWINSPLMQDFKQFECNMDHKRIQQNYFHPSFKVQHALFI